MSKPPTITEQEAIELARGVVFANHKIWPKGEPRWRIEYVNRTDVDMILRHIFVLKAQIEE